MTAYQKRTIADLLDEMKPESVVHGMCVGADEQFDLLAKNRGIFRIGYPCNIPSMRADLDCNMTYAPMEPLLRNKVIVDRCDFLIACPQSSTEVQRSGTWATIRYARNVHRDRQIVTL